MLNNSFGNLLYERVMSGIPMMSISTKEPPRVLAEIQQLCQTKEEEVKENKKIKPFSAFTWSLSHGLEPIHCTTSAHEVLEAFINEDVEMNGPHTILEIWRTLEKEQVVNERIMIIICGASYVIEMDAVKDFIREIASQNRLNNINHLSSLLFLDANFQPPNDISHWLIDIELSPLDRNEVMQVISRCTSGLESSMITISEQGMDQLVQTLTGLTQFEIQNILAYCFRIHRGMNDDILETAEQEAVKAVKSEGILHYIPKSQIDKIEDLKGFDNLIKFVEGQKVAYSAKGRKVGIDLPKGISLIGVPGTGKSAVAKAVARVLGMPLYIMDVSAVFGSLVGESESRMRNALQSISSQRGAVLLLDEADKALGGMSGSSTDSGVSKRVFGQLLTWLAEKKDETYVITTMNRIDGIPPEFLRKGRFDEIFYTDIPDAEIRKEIIRVHFTKRGFECNATDEELIEVAEEAGNYIGSEIEEMVKHCLRETLNQDRDPCFDKEIMLNYIANTKTMYELNKQEVQAIRDFCKDRATSVFKSAQKSHSSIQPTKMSLNRTISSDIVVEKNDLTPEKE